MIHAEVRTKTECRVRLYDPGHAMPQGEGVMLALDMVDPEDGRHAEVYLDLDAVLAVHEGLDRWLMRR